MIVNKPWGYEKVWALTEKYVGKILHINEGHRLSLQYHELKEETIMVTRGVLELVLEEKSRKHKQTLILQAGDTYHISPFTIHRFCATQGTDVEIVEVSTTELYDVVRIEDDHGRK